MYAQQKTGYGVTDIREQVVKDIKVRPYQSKYKIYIIEQAELMTVQAQNSILKTIEEPPEYGLFFLVSSNSHKFLQTILSRSVKMSLKPISTKQIEEYLSTQYGMNYTQARVYGSFSRGNLGKALILKESEKLYNPNDKNMLKCLEIFINGKDYDIIEVVQLFEEIKADILENIDILISLSRDILYYHGTQDIDNIIHKDIEQEIIRLSQRVNANRLIRLVYNSYTLINQLRLNVNYSLAVTVMLTNMNNNAIDWRK